MNYASWSMSEKFDGVSATCDGTSLVSRDGNRFNAPEWFVAGLPARRLVGELWSGRGRFEETCSVVRSRDAGDRWREIRYLVFDGPAGLPLGEFAAHVKQIPCVDQATVDAFYGNVLARGGEGIMLRDTHGDCVKRKPIVDDDGVVVGYTTGKGRHAGHVGALVLEDRDGRRFRLGVGLCDADRQNPPPLGSIVKFSLQGRTANGLPRFASFLGWRAETRIVLTNHTPRRVAARIDNSLS